jgi:hypothetical protein
MRTGKLFRGTSRQIGITTYRIVIFLIQMPRIVIVNVVIRGIYRPGPHSSYLLGQTLFVKNIDCINEWDDCDYFDRHFHHPSAILSDPIPAKAVSKAVQKSS